MIYNFLFKDAAEETFLILPKNWNERDSLPWHSEIIDELKYNGIQSKIISGEVLNVYVFEGIGFEDMPGSAGSGILKVSITSEYDSKTGILISHTFSMDVSGNIKGTTYGEVTGTGSLSITAIDISKEPEQTQQQSKGGGCLIATAAFGSEMAPQVQFLRELRDNTVLQTESGTSFMTGFNQFYYSFSPTIADYERENPAFKEAVKITLTPLLSSLTLLQYADIDSESEMLGYGIGVILLNIGMYFVAPAVLIMAVRKRV